MDRATPELFDLTKVSRSFPPPAVAEIHRENVLAEIELYLETKGIRLVQLTGQEGIGRTTIMSQFARRHGDKAISLFVTPTSRWGYDLEALRMDLCNQLEWVLRSRFMPEDEEITDAELARRLVHVNTRATQQGRPFFILLDGVDDIPEDAAEIRAAIFNLAPFDFQGLRFVIASDTIPDSILRATPHKVVSVGLLSPEETQRYLSDLNLEQEDLQELHRICFGIPRRLASLRRILSTGVSVQTVLRMPQKVPEKDLFEVEWHNVDEQDSCQRRLLAVLAFDRGPWTHERLASLFDLSGELVKEQFRGLAFLSASDSRQVTYVCEAFRLFAASKLADLREKTLDRVIGGFMAAPDSPESITLLPTLLRQAGRLEELLSYLSPEHFQRILEQTDSLAPMQEKAQLAVETSSELRRDADLVGFAVQRSFIEGLRPASSGRSVIAAIVSLGDYDSAMNLAQQARLKEDRLHLLVALARARHDKGLSDDSALSGQIRSLYQQIDPEKLATQDALSLASDLIHVLPDLAIDIVNRIAGDEGQSKLRLDWALARLAIEAVLGRGVEGDENDSVVEDLRGRIRDPMVKRISEEVRLLVGQSSSAEVLNKVEALEPGDRLFLLRQWTKVNRDRPDALRVVASALTLAIGDSDTTVDARLLRELATPLPYSDNPDQVQELVARFNSQLPVVVRLGPTEEYVRLQLTLARAECSYDRPAARERLVDIALHCDEAGDLVTRCSCWARLLEALPTMDPCREFEQRDKLHTMALDALRLAWPELLSATADHYEATRATVKALATAAGELVIALIADINTEYRRDRALLGAIGAACRVPPHLLDWEFVNQAVAALRDDVLRDDAVLAVLAAASRLDKGNPVPAQAKDFSSHVPDMRDLSKKCLGYYHVHELWQGRQEAKADQLAADALASLETSWSELDVPWEKTDAGYALVAKLGSSSLSAACSFHASVMEYKSRAPMDDPGAGRAQITGLRLLIRAYAGLLRAGQATDGDQEAVMRLLEGVAAPGPRLELIGELAVRAHLAGRAEQCKHVVRTGVKPFLEVISKHDFTQRYRVLVAIAPALFYAHETSAHSTLEVMPRRFKDVAYGAIITSLLTGCYSFEPCELGRDPKYCPPWDDIDDATRLLQYVESDHVFYECSGLLCQVLTSSSGRRQYTDSQRLETHRQVLDLIARKLPDPRSIRHRGYVIACKALAEKLHKSSRQTWADLLKETAAIPNLSDRAYVYALVADAMPTRERERRDKAFAKAHEIARQVPVYRERAERLATVAKLAHWSNPVLARDCLREAMGLSVSDPDIRTVHRRIIDTAYAIDPDFAESLVKMVDDESVRLPLRHSLRSWLNEVAAARTAAARNSAPTAESQHLPNLAWSLLGLLNGGRVAPWRGEHVRPLVKMASVLPLERAYPVYAWALETTHRSSSGSQQTVSNRATFEALLRANQLACSVVRAVAGASAQTSRALGVGASDDAFSVPAGSREKGLEYIRNWLERVSPSHLLVCDPYFGPEDLDTIHLVRSCVPLCSISVITGRRRQVQAGVLEPWSKAYRSAWRQRYDESPPPTRILVAGRPSDGDCPLHDRYWLAETEGLSIGTSLGSLGLSKPTSISVLRPRQLAEQQALLQPYLDMLPRSYRGEVLWFDSFTLG